MKTPQDLRIAFQGGGAKLVDLLAAVQAIQELQRSGDIRVTRVSGTSAGSIAAGLLATDTSAETFSRIIEKKGPDFVSRLVPENRYPRNSNKFNKLRAAYNVYRGIPLANPKELRKIIWECFSEANDMSMPKNFSECSKFVDDFSVIVTDICNRTKYVSSVKKSPNDNIYEKITDSCALPIVFRTHEHLALNPYVDGGLCQNFPIDEVSKDSNENELIIGFSFSRDEHINMPDNILDYSLSLIGNAIDQLMESAIKENSGALVYNIKTKIKTHEFDRALQKISSTEFSDLRDDIRSWVVRQIESKKSASYKPSVTDLLTINSEIYRKIFFNTDYNLLRGGIIVKASGLADPANESIYNPYDEIRDVCLVEPKSAPLYAISTATNSWDQNHPTILPKTVVYNFSKTRTIDTLLLPALRKGEENKDLLSHETIVFFQEPLKPNLSKSQSFWVIESSFRRKTMQPLLDDGSDIMAVKNGRPTVMQEANLILYVPEDFPTIVMKSLVKERNFEGIGKPGEIMMEEEMLFYGEVPVGFRPCGWKVSKVGPGEWCGVKFSIQG